MRFLQKCLTLFLGIALVFYSTPCFAASPEPLEKEEANEVVLENETASLQATSKKVLLTKKAKKTKHLGLTKIGSHYYYYYKNGKKAKSTWKTIGGQRYFFRSNCQAATGTCKAGSKYYIFDSRGRLFRPSKNKQIKVGKYRFLVGPGGKAVTGWQVISGKLYHASFSGKCVVGTTYDKIPFNSLGYAKPSNKRAKLMILALNTIKRITNDKMTLHEKLVACFAYSNYSMRWVGDLFPPDGTSKSNNTETVKNLKSDWQIEWAYKTLTEKRENCWGQTCAFCALAKALGKDPYIICDIGIHTSARIDGKHWDRVGYIIKGDKPYYTTNTKLTMRFW